MSGRRLLALVVVALLALGGYALARSGSAPTRNFPGWTAYAPLDRQSARRRSEPYRLYTHCGVSWAWIRGTFWRASPTLSDGQSNPPAGWGNPFQRGTLVFVHPATAIFTSTAGAVTFHRTSRKRPPLICS